ncbi:MAG TPA: hypothetical protein VGA69_12155 [Nitriliruptorales bacterium]
MAPKQMTNEHKKALAEGRQQAAAVRDYLAYLDRDRKPGRRLSKEEIAGKISQLGADIEVEDDPARRVELIQKRLDYEARLANIGDAPNVEALRAAFVDAVKPYSERKKISYTAWREAGVPAADLAAAGIKRTRRTT